MRVSYYENIKNRTSVIKTITEVLHPTPSAITKIKAYRAKMPSLTQKQRQEMKQLTLPAFTASCISVGCHDEVLERSGLICIDIDHLPSDSLVELKDQLKQWKYTFAVYVSVSTDGLAVIVKIPTDGEFAGYFYSLEKYFQDKFSVTIDEKCKNINRLRFVSHDKDLYINEDSKVWTESFMPEKKKTEYGYNSISLNQNNVKNIPISAYLQQRGYMPTKENETDAQFKSPLREGKNRNSLHVDKKINCWFDFGSRQGGSIIDLVTALDDVTNLEAIQILRDGNITPHRPTIIPDKQTLPFIPCGYLHRKQKEYIESRGIYGTALYKDLFQTIRRGNYYGLGWQDINGKWHYRSGDIKLSESGATYSIINNGSQNVLVFEGVFTALSFLTIYPAYIGWDVIILNSVINTNKAINALRDYDRIVSLCDNDEAGIQASLSIKAEIAQTEIYNQLCDPYNDWNDYLMAKKQTG